jgi:hypothetical protein
MTSERADAQGACWQAIDAYWKAKGVGLLAELRVKETMATNSARSAGEVKVEPD